MRVVRCQTLYVLSELSFECNAVLISKQKHTTVHDIAKCSAPPMSGISCKRFDVSGIVPLTWARQLETASCN